MKSWTGAALAAVIAATAAPAMAGGYWDAGASPNDPPSPPPCAPHGPPCQPPPCPSDYQGAWREPVARAWDETHLWRRVYGDDDERVVVPAEFFEDGGGVGPDTFIDESGGGGVIVAESGAFAGAEASAYASARIHVGLRGGRFQRHVTPHCACGRGGRR